jgi:polyisoprenoid-binding protein YceI
MATGDLIWSALRSRQGAALFCALASLAMAAEGAGTATAEIRFAGTSTLHGFKGHATAEPFALELREEPATHEALATASARVKVSALTTDHEARDRKMRDMLDLERFASIDGSIRDAHIPTSGSGPVELLLKIRGLEHTVSAAASEWRKADGSTSFRLAFPVSLRAFGLKPPSVLGMIRVGDEVRVECDVSSSMGSIPAPPAAQEGP